MRYTDYLNRSMDRLTTAEWERLLTSPAVARHDSAFVACPCCRVVLAVELKTCDDTLASDTRTDLAAVTHTDLAAYAEPALVAA